MEELSRAEGAEELDAYWEVIDKVKMLPGFPTDMEITDEVVLVPLDKPVIYH